MDESPPRPARRVPLLGWVVIAVLVAVGAALAIPLQYWFKMKARHDNVAAALHQLGSHEATWRQGDFDRNGVADYWTRDVAGLYYIRGERVGAVAMIDVRLARADKAPAVLWDAQLAGGPEPEMGYFFQAMLFDGEGRPYVQADAPPPKAINAPPGACTNRNLFGFTAFAHRYGYDGNLVFILDESGIVLEKDIGTPGGILNRKSAGCEAAESGWGQV